MSAVLRVLLGMREKIMHAIPLELKKAIAIGIGLFIAFIGLYDGGIVPDPDGIITAGHENKTARTVAFRQGEPVNEPALSAMFRQIIANNRAGGWRKLKRES